jgi:hypothetical protein
MDTKTKNPILEQKLEDASIDGAVVAFDPEEADQLGAMADDMPEQDVIDAAFDDEI